MIEMQIKPIETEEELLGKAAVHYLGWQQAYGGLIEPGHLITRQKALEIARNSRQKVLIAKTGGQVIGFIGYGRYRGEDLQNTGEIYGLYIFREYYGQKVGYRLMNRAVEALGQFPRIVLWVFKDNERAIRFYQRYGFRFDGTEMPFAVEPRLIECRMILQTGKDDRK